MKDLEKPVILQQKIDYFTHKIVQVLQQTWQSDNMHFKLDFAQYIDSSIDSLYSISKKYQQRAQKEKKKSQLQKSQAQQDNNQDKDQSNREKNRQKKQYQQNEKAKLYSNDKEKLQIQKLIYQSKLHELSIQQQKLQNQKLIIKAQTQQLKKKGLQAEHQKKIYILKEEIDLLAQKTRNQQKQLQRLGKINIHQTKQIEILKQERNRAQSNEIKIRQQYERIVKNTEQFGNKGHVGNKMKNSQGLQIKKIFSNFSEKKQSQKYIILDLPVVFEANKIVYGISIGLQLSSRQIVYCDDIRIFQKQIVRITAEQSHIKAQYVKRKQSTLSTKFKIHRPQIVIMLFGKGDSITVHQ